MKKLASLVAFVCMPYAFANFIPEEHEALIDEVLEYCEIQQGQDALSEGQASCLQGVISLYEYPDIRCQGEDCDHNKTEEQHCRDFANSLRAHASDMGNRTWDSQTQPNDRAGAETHILPAIYDIGCGFEATRDRMRYRCQGEGKDKKRKEPPVGRPNPNGIPLS